MMVLGYIGAMMIGIVLALLGAGGSILALPILVYLFGIDPIVATGYSLFIIGVTSGYGTIQKIKISEVCFKTGLLLGIPSILGVFLTRLFLVPALPATIMANTFCACSKESFIMLLFSALILISGILMIRNKRKEVAFSNHKMNLRQMIVLAIEGFGVGILTGIVGAGGGFILVPVLILILKMPMKLAIGTSMFIIMMKSLIGFGGDIIHGMDVDWLFLLKFILVAIFGVFIGLKLSERIEGASLKRAFGFFLVVVSISIFTNEFF